MLKDESRSEWFSHFSSIIPLLPFYRDVHYSFTSVIRASSSTASGLWSHAYDVNERRDL